MQYLVGALALEGNEIRTKVTTVVRKNGLLCSYASLREGVALCVVSA